MRVRFRNSKFFDGDDYDLTDLGFETYKIVRGRLSKDGRSVRGEFLQIEHSPSPEDWPGCLTFGFDRWEAERRR